MDLDLHSRNKQFISRFRKALYDCDPANLNKQLGELFAADCNIQLAHPLGELAGPDALYQVAYAPLLGQGADRVDEDRPLVRRGRRHRCVPAAAERQGARDQEKGCRS